jgi:hypothetical protein
MQETIKSNRLTTKDMSLKDNIRISNTMIMQLLTKDQSRKITNKMEKSDG